MIQKLLTIGLPLLSPFAVYLVWSWATRRRALAESEGEALPAWQNLPWTWLIIASAALTSLALVLTAVIDGGGEPGEHRTPRVEDGKLIPGRMER